MTVFFDTNVKNYPTDAPAWFVERLEAALPDILKIKNAGFNIVAYSVMIVEGTYIFETSEDAKNAFDKFENCEGPSTIQGWWYDADNFFNKYFPEYVEKNKTGTFEPVCAILIF